MADMGDVAGAGTVFVVDDDDAVRDALSLLLEASGLDVRAYASAMEFLKARTAGEAGVLVADIRMPAMSGLELQLHLREAHDLVPIIFITGHGDIPMAVQAMQDGALDFLRKPVNEQELLDRVRQGLVGLGESVAEREEIAGLVDRAETLTRREREVFHRVANGQANKVVAIELGISERTVEIHRSHVMHKMAARSLAHLVRMKIRLEQSAR